MKTCKKCQEEKPLSSFSLWNRAADGRQPNCKTCVNAYMKQRVATLGAQINAKRREDYAKNIDKKRAQNKQNYERHKEKRLEYQEKYRKAPENREAIRARSRAWKLRKLAEDPLFALKHTVSCLLRVSLIKKNASKRSKTVAILGCDWDFFMLHIERQFKPGMTWENRREWHIDHIVPLATAVTEEDVLALNHFTNLRPMWASDNLKKNAKVTHLI